MKELFKLPVIEVIEFKDNFVTLSGNTDVPLEPDDF